VARAREYGHIPGFPVGSEFASRAELSNARVHRPLQGGISGGQDGADSIVVSGGYPDDEDYDDELVYTGQGGRDPNTGRQIADQELVLGNIGLVRSQFDERPVRVIRGAGGEPAYSPARGLRYDGLYQVVDHWHDVGQDGFRIWRFRLVKLEAAAVISDSVAPSSGPAPRAHFAGSRIVRNRLAADRVKRLHDFTCQICGIRLTTSAGPYAEGAHIKGLGRPHNGPDDETNILCLCPNDHFMFDAGALYVDDDSNVRLADTNEVFGRLRTVPRHQIDQSYFKYHREHFATP
jgi:putative restriction endonuclease